MARMVHMTISLRLLNRMPDDRLAEICSCSAEAARAEISRLLGEGKLVVPSGCDNELPDGRCGGHEEA